MGKGTRQDAFREVKEVHQKVKREKAKTKRRNIKLRNIESKHAAKVRAVRDKFKEQMAHANELTRAAISRARWTFFGIGVVVGGAVAVVAGYLVTRGWTV